jgi:AcrR family transcriptional regulator
MAVIAPDAGTLDHRIADAVVRCVGRWGVAKTTLDDVAREAGCSRATVYRTFPGGKDPLIKAALAAELHRFGEGLAQRLGGADTLEDVLVGGMTHAGTFILDHEALQFLLAHEPELILPSISFGRMTRVLRTASAFAAPYLSPYVGEEEAPRVAEWVARIVFSYAVSPDDRVDLRDEESVRRLVRTFVLPGVTSTQTQGR